jgi:hypothetical protein
MVAYSRVFAQISSENFSARMFSARMYSVRTRKRKETEEKRSPHTTHTLYGVRSVRCTLRGYDRSKQTLRPLKIRLIRFKKLKIETHHHRNQTPDTKPTAVTCHMSSPVTCHPAAAVTLPCQCPSLSLSLPFVRSRALHCKIFEMTTAIRF